MIENLDTGFEVVIRFLDEETANSAAIRINKQIGYITHVREVAT